MKIEKNKVVSVTYKLESNPDGAERALVEVADETRPLIFLFGSGGMIPAFEENLLGRIKGDKIDFSIAPDDAYGQMEAEAVVDLPLDIFKVDGVVDMSMLQTGNVVPMNDREGNSHYGKVVAISGESVKMDFNHPLAGHQLHFSVEVMEVREPSAEELSHGHAHHEGDGHHH